MNEHEKLEHFTEPSEVKNAREYLAADASDSLGRTAIIAGNGQLPVAVAQVLAERGENPFLIPLRDEAASQLYAYPHQEISIIEFAKLIRTLKSHAIKNIVLAGGVTRRPSLRNLRLDWPTLRILPRIAFVLGRGDDALLRAFIGALESYQFHVYGAHQIVPELLASKRMRLSKHHPTVKMQADITLAAQAAQMLGKLDVGQGAVAVGGRIVALEGAEGTDEMLARVQQLRAQGRIPAKGGVLVKVMKPAQEARADLPTIGPKTIETTHAAGLSGVVVEAEHSFIIEPDKTMRLADQYGLFIDVIELKTS